MTIEDLLAQVLQLPRQERARVAEQLLYSLKEPEEQVALAWASVVVLACVHGKRNPQAIRARLRGGA